MNSVLPGETTAPARLRRSPRAGTRAAVVAASLLALCVGAGEPLVPAAAAKGPAGVQLAKAGKRHKKGRKAAKGKAAKGPSKKELKIRRTLFMAQYYERQEKNYKAAMKAYAKVLKLDKTRVKAGLALAELKFKQGDVKGATKVIKGLRKHNPERAIVHRVYGKLLRMQKKPGKALEAFRKACEVQPKDAPSHRAAAELLNAKLTAGDKTVIPELVKHLRAYVRYTKFKDGPRYLDAQRVLALVDGGKVGLTIFDGTKAYKDAWTSARMGRINKRMDEARQHFERCVQIDPKRQVCHLFLGRIFSSVKASKSYDLARAKAELAKADKLPAAWVELGTLLRREDDAEGAERALKKALALSPDNQRALYQLAVLYKLDGRDDQAVAALTRCYRANRYSSVASDAMRELASLAPDNKLVRVAFQRGQLRGTIYSTEKYKGAMALLEKRFGGVDPKALQTPVLEAILHRLIEANDISTEHTFNVQVLNTGMVNAFAAPNGNIYFTKGFFRYLKKFAPNAPVDADNAVIAHVMAHEMTHVLRRHTVRSAVYQEAIADASKRLDPAVLIHVTRLHEIEADRQGIVMAFLAGYSPRAGIDFMIARGKDSEIPAHLDHPTYDERVHYLEEYWSNDVKYAWMSFRFGLDAMKKAEGLERTDVAKAMDLYQEAARHFTRFSDVLKPTREIRNNLGIAYAKVGVLALSKSRVSPLNRWRTGFSVERDLALAYVNLKGEKKRATRGEGGGAVVRIPWQLTQAIDVFERAVKLYPKYVRPKVNLATTYLAVGRLDDATEALKGLTAGPHVSAAELANLRGVLAAEGGRYAEASKLFAAAGGEAAVRAQARFNAARTLAVSGDKARARGAYERFLADFPKDPWAPAAKAALAGLSAGKPSPTK